MSPITDAGGGVLAAPSPLAVLGAELALDAASDTRARSGSTSSGHSSSGSAAIVNAQFMQSIAGGGGLVSPRGRANSSAPPSAAPSPAASPAAAASAPASGSATPLTPAGPPIPNDAESMPISTATTSRVRRIDVPSDALPALITVTGGRDALTTSSGGSGGGGGGGGGGGSLLAPASAPTLLSSIATAAPPTQNGADETDSDGLMRPIECITEIDQRTTLVLTPDELRIASANTVIDIEAPLFVKYCASLKKYSLTNDEKRAIMLPIDIAMARNYKSVRICDVPATDLQIFKEEVKFSPQDAVPRPGSKTWHIMAWLVGDGRIQVKLARETEHRRILRDTYKYALVADWKTFSQVAESPLEMTKRELDTTTQQLLAERQKVTTRDNVIAGLQRANEEKDALLKRAIVELKIERDNVSIQSRQITTLLEEKDRLSNKLLEQVLSGRNLTPSARHTTAAPAGGGGGDSAAAGEPAAGAALGSEPMRQMAASVASMPFASSQLGAASAGSASSPNVQGRRAPSAQSVFSRDETPPGALAAGSPETAEPAPMNGTCHIDPAASAATPAAAITAVASIAPAPTASAATPVEASLF